MRVKRPFCGAYTEESGLCDVNTLSARALVTAVLGWCQPFPSMRSMDSKWIDSNAPAAARARHVRPAASLVYKTILCPTEFSDPSTRALTYALTLAEETDARLILLHVIEGFIDHERLAAPRHRRHGHAHR
ncbi:MAG: universal stress protein [Acidobacteria bacterium]|nr:universal stress protein [Acidobacteriota bacterium]